MKWQTISEKMWEEILAKIHELYDSGYTIQSIADMLGLKTKSNVSNWMKGKGLAYNTPFPKMMEYLDALDIDYAKFFPKKKRADGLEMISVYDTVAGGQPIDVQECEPICEVLVPESYATGCDFAAKVQGNSMAPYAPDGSIVGISKNCEFVLGEIYLTYIAYHGRTIKRVLRSPQGDWILRSENPDKCAYPDIVIDASESENLIIGKVVWVLKRS